MTAIWDVVGLGCTTVDDLLYVPEYPGPERKVLVEHRIRQCGGLTATALVAAARQGVRCAYAGCLGEDEDSQFVLAALREEGIETSTVGRNNLAGPIHSTIIVDTTANTRNIFFQRPQIIGPVESSSLDECVRAARVLFVDHYGGLANVKAMDLARKHGIPIVADLERSNVPEFGDIVRRVNHLILSERFATELSGQSDPRRAAEALLRDAAQIVVVTCGAQGCWVAERSSEQCAHVPAFPVQVVDTTGCGDTFHGVYSAELARMTELTERIQRAAAAAAIKSRQAGAQAGIPRRWEVDQFLAQNRH